MKNRAVLGQIERDDPETAGARTAGEKPMLQAGISEQLTGCMPKHALIQVYRDQQKVYQSVAQG